MEQYHVIVNLDKKEYLHPHSFGDGLKFLEFGASGNGTMLGLAAFLAVSLGQGGGDLCTENPLQGSWAKDQIVIVGDDYGDGTYDIAQDSFVNISKSVVDMITDDDDIMKEMLEHVEYIHDKPVADLIKAKAVSRRLTSGG